ncbi:MAG: hypothetical protein IT223_08730 [Crocinitomicaceae bacterium]|nr:hypothetical protein [Crocinitomicaceae bacterium]
MKNLYCTSLLIFLFANAAFSQETDSMKYYVNRFADRTLSEQGRKEAGLKIRRLQKERYFQSKREAAGDTLLPYLEDQIAAGFRQIDAATEQLIAIVSNVEINNAVRWKALRTLSQINTFMADSFLVANIDRLNYLGEYSGGSSGEIDWMYPCFGLLSSKSALNYTLIKPILSNLHTPKTESELYFIDMLLLGIFGTEESVRLWEDHMLSNAENFVISKNLESLRDIKK